MNAARVWRLTGENVVVSELLGHLIGHPQRQVIRRLRLARGLLCRIGRDVPEVLPGVERARIGDVITAVDQALGLENVLRIAHVRLQLGRHLTGRLDGVRECLVPGLQDRVRESRIQLHGAVA